MKSNAEIILFADVRDLGCCKAIHAALVNTNTERRVNNTTFTTHITTENIRHGIIIFSELISIIRAKKIQRITLVTGDAQTIAQILDCVSTSGVEIDIYHYSTWTGRRHLFDLLSLDELQFALYGTRYNRDNYIRGAIKALFYVFDVELGCKKLHQDILNKISIHYTSYQNSNRVRMLRGINTSSEFEVFSSKYEDIIKRLVCNKPL